MNNIWRFHFKFEFKYKWQTILSNFIEQTVGIRDVSETKTSPLSNVSYEMFRNAGNIELKEWNCIAMNWKLKKCT